MAITAQELIERARDFHASFHPEIHPDQVLLRALRRAERRFINRAIQLAPNALALDHVFDESEITAGIQGTPLTPPSFRMLLPTAVLATSNDELLSVSIVEEEQSSGINPLQIRLVGRSLYIAQPAAFQTEMPSDLSSHLQGESDFQDGKALRVTYVPNPDGSLALDDNITAPDDAEDFLVGDLVHFMALRVRDREIAQERQGLLSEGVMLQEDVIQMYAERSGSETRWYVSEIG